MNLILIVGIYCFLLFRIWHVSRMCAPLSAKRNYGHGLGVIMRGTSGFSLIEMLIVVAIMAITLGMVSLSFNAWSRGRNMENQVRELFVDLNDARARAFHEKKTYRMIFQPNSYVLTSYDFDSDPDDQGTQILSKNVPFTMTRRDTSGNMGADISAYQVDFTSNGLADNNFTVVVNPLSDDPPLNCLVIFDSRINLGKVNGSDCEFK